MKFKTKIIKLILGSKLTSTLQNFSLQISLATAPRILIFCDHGPKLSKKSNTTTVHPYSSVKIAVFNQSGNLQIHQSKVTCLYFSYSSDLTYLIYRRSYSSKKKTSDVSPNETESLYVNHKETQTRIHHFVLYALTLLGKLAYYTCSLKLLTSTKRNYYPNYRLNACCTWILNVC